MQFGGGDNWSGGIVGCLWVCGRYLWFGHKLETYVRARGVMVIVAGCGHDDTS